MTAFRLIVGRKTDMATSAEVLALAMRIADRAWALGLTVSSFYASHAPQSASRYLTVRDARGQQWDMRVSNHRRPRTNSHAAPHFDLVSLDGHSGFKQVAEWLERVALGKVEWQPARPNGRRRKARRRRR